MRIHFENIGPVGTADLTLGNLTIIVGRNNTGKTYLTYALYGFLRSWTGWPYAESFFLGPEYATLRRQGASTLPTIQRLTRSILNDGRALHQLDYDHLLACRHRILRELSNHFSADLLPTVFSSSSDDFGDARIAVELLDPIPDRTVIGVEVTRNRRLSLDYRASAITCEWKGNTSPPRDLSDMVARGLFMLLCSGFHEPFLLSAERFGISLFHRELDLAKSKVIDYLQKMGTEDEATRKSPFVVIDKSTSRYAVPIKDNIDFTRGIPEIRRRLGPLAQQQRTFNDIKEMMDGYYKVSGDDISFKSKSRGERAYEIPLHIASSSARGLSDLYFFLKHVAASNHLLIIDEPESHLDTRNQIRLARMLSRLVRLGIRVLITTHSDYLLKEINNLIMLSHLPDGSEGMRRKLKYNQDDALPASEVKAYIAQNDTLDEVPITKFGMTMPLFDTTIDEINTVANALGFALSD